MRLWYRGCRFTDHSGEVFDAFGCGRKGSVLGLLHPKVLQAIWKASHVGDPNPTTGGDRYTLAGALVQWPLLGVERCGVLKRHLALRDSLLFLLSGSSLRGVS